MSSVIAETRTGKVRGSIQKASDHSEFYVFKGIPYAKPPVGQLRFRDPEPIEPWNGIREATTYGSCCAQFDRYTWQLKGSEDCLYLNVFTKNMKFRVGRPVIVWIHAGLFLFGSGDDFFYGPEHFMRKDVVFVTFNHRLGVFGFLNLDDEEASGNQGMKDQVMVLEWVRDNIANFGGDPNNVTIAGSSSGSACAHYLAVSPLARGLYHKVILQSGVLIHPWAFQFDSQEKAHRLCEFLNHQKKDSKSTIEFLRTIDAHQLAMAPEKMEAEENKIQLAYPFPPSIDDKAKKPFMPVHPEVAAREGIRVPLLIGQTNREGLFFRKEIQETITKFKGIHKLLHASSVHKLKELYNLTPEDLKLIYFGNISVTGENLNTAIDLYGDLSFYEGIHRVVKTQVEKGCSSTYFYQFSYDKKLVPPAVSTNPKISGAGHGHELTYMFNMQFHSNGLEILEKDSEKRKITERMVELWVNFATSGNPTPQTSNLIPVSWQPVDNCTVFNYLDIGDDLRMDTMLSLEQRYLNRVTKTNRSLYKIFLESID